MIIKVDMHAHSVVVTATNTVFEFRHENWKKKTQKYKKKNWPDLLRGTVDSSNFIRNMLTTTQHMLSLGICQTW